MIKCDGDCETIKVSFCDDNDPIVVNLGAYSGSIDDYNMLIHKPSIDGVELVGDLTSEDLGLVKSYDQLQDRPSLDGITLTGDMSYSDFGFAKSYDELSDRPSIDGVTLTGNLTSADLGLVKSYDELNDRPSIDGVTLTGDLTSADLGLVKSYNELADIPTLNGNVIEGDNTNQSLGIVLLDTFSKWTEKSSLVTGDGTIYVYTDYPTIVDEGTSITYPGVKIGDGHSTLGSLPFINSPDPRVLNHISNYVIHITSSERESWNQALTDISNIKSQMVGTMHSIGETSTNLSDGSTTRPIRVNGQNYYQSQGDVVRHNDKEYLYTENNTWIELGFLGAKVYRGSVEYWRNRRYLIAERDVVYIYTDYKVIDNGDGTTTIIQGMKIGDGTSFLIDMPFIGDGGSGGGGNVTPEDINNWNNKWSGYINPSNPENLVFVV